MRENKQFESEDCQKSIFHTILDSVSSCDTTKEFLDAIEKKFKKSNKAEIGNLMNKFTNTKYDNVECLREILIIVQIAMRPIEFKMHVPIISLSTMSSNLNLWNLSS